MSLPCNGDLLRPCDRLKVAPARTEGEVPTCLERSRRSEVEGRLRELIEAQQHLRTRLLEISRLSEQQCHVPADRPDALLALLDRKHGVLRELCAIDAPTLFRDCAAVVGANGDDDAHLREAKARLHREAASNLELWKQIVNSEERARNHGATCVQRLSAELSNARRKGALQRAYAEPDARGAAVPRFVNHLR